MKDLIQQIRLLIKAIYLLIVLVFLFNISFFLQHYVPATATESEPKSYPNSWIPKSLVSDIPDGKEGERIKHGFRLITETSKYVGPQAMIASKQYAGNNLSCNNCHLDAGRKIGSASFIGVTNRFPQYRGRENKMGTIEERINGCMERSMNGKAMPPDSEEIQAMIAYMKWLSEDVSKDIDSLYQGFTRITIPTIQVDTILGKNLFITKCQRCHGDKGEGVKKPDNEFEYIYPPLSGEDTFNDGAGMTRVITAAEFIKGNMPFGATYDSPQVTDEEAYHIAGYISTFPRPVKTNSEADYPDKKLKPVSTPYGPWADTFSADQHKYGPFQPIFAFYKDQYGLEKSK